MRLTGSTDGLMLREYSLSSVSYPPDDEASIDPITHFEACVNALFEYALRNIDDGDMVGLVIMKITKKLLNMTSQ
jgi:hypothetical protein